MNIADVGRILLLASGLDRFVVVDAVTTQAWTHALAIKAPDLDYETAKDATIEHYTGPAASERFGVHHLLAIVGRSNRTTDAAIAADIRSAKARGIIGREWPDDIRLPAEVLDQLSRIRAGETAEAHALDELVVVDGIPIAVGTIGRRA